MNEIRAAFEKYRDPVGFIQGRPGASSGNGLLFTAEAYIAMLARGAITVGEGAPELVATVQKVEAEPGRYRRTPDGQWASHDEEGPDDHIGLAAMSWAFGLPYAERLLEYGRTHTAKLGQLTDLAEHEVLSTDWRWLVPGLHRLLSWFNADKALPYNYSTNDPQVVTRDSWLGRFPAVIAHFHWAADETPAWYLRLYWAFQIGVIAPRAKSSDCDAWILSWLLIYVMAGRSWLGRWAARRWFAALDKNFKGGMNEVFATYFGPEHPTAKYFVTKIEGATNGKG